MKQITSFLFALRGTSCLLASCDNHGLKKTKSGILYRVRSRRKEFRSLRRGQFMKLSFTRKLRDSVFFSSAAYMPAYVPMIASGECVQSA